MPRALRPITPTQAATDAARAFRENFEYLFEKLHLSQERLAETVKRRGGALSQKSISNIKNLSHRSTLSAYSQVAEALGVPVWVMLIPNLRKELLDQPYAHRFTKLIADYACCNDEQRDYIEKMAAGYAGLNNGANSNEK